jgi:hypothetical protein
VIAAHRREADCGNSEAVCRLRGLAEVLQLGLVSITAVFLLSEISD